MKKSAGGQRTHSAHDSTSAALVSQMRLMLSSIGTPCRLRQLGRGGRAGAARPLTSPRLYMDPRLNMHEASPRRAPSS
jgi:hypothetical protein